MHSHCVLIVDDNPMLRRAICELFTRTEDFEVCGEAEDGLDAIDKARALQPVLIVTDLSMPRMNGLDATRALKKLMPDVPIILYSIHIDPAIAKEAMAAGASAVVPKGEAVAKLIQIARELIRCRAA